MAASSIIENIRVNNPMLLEEYVDAMDGFSKQEISRRTDERRSGVITDPAEIRAIARKNLEKKGRWIIND